MSAPCTAPKTQQHQTAAAAAECPIHGKRVGKSVNVPPLLGARRGTRFDKAATNERVINGLVARRQESSGQFTLAHAADGEPVFHRARLGGGRQVGLYDTAGEALEWAETTYPMIAKAATSTHRPRGTTRRFCPQCHRPMVIAEEGLHACPSCVGVTLDYT